MFYQWDKVTFLSDVLQKIIILVDKHWPYDVNGETFSLPFFIKFLKPFIKPKSETFYFL